MGRIETFDHTADLGLRVIAGNQSDLFESAAMGLFDVIVANRADVEVREEVQITLAADSIEDLMLAWLNELIFHSETRHSLYSRFSVELDPQGCSLHARVGGEPIDVTRHVLDHEVKAATRHGLLVKPIDGGWMAEVILDI